MPTEPNEGAGLLDEIESRLHRYVSLSSDRLAVVALWVLHTHAFEAAEATPYLLITSPERESGKTRLLEVLDLYAARTWLTGRVTAAVVTRKIDAEQPTLLLDESDRAFGAGPEYAEALTGILNTGYRRGGRASVCVAHGANIGYRDLSTFCPKAIAGLGRSLPDTVASRGLPITMSRRTQAETVARFRRREAAEEAEPIYKACTSWAEAHFEALREARPELPNELGDRAADCVEPLLAIADLAGGDWPEKARKAVVALYSDMRHEDESHGVLLLRDVRGVFDGRGLDKMASATVIASLIEIEDSPWAEWRGRGLTVHGLAHLLKPYRVRPRTIRLEDGRTPKGYKREQFREAWARYLSSDPPQPPQAGLDADSRLIPSRHEPQEVAVSVEPTIAHRQTGVASVATGVRGLGEPGFLALLDRSRADHLTHGEWLERSKLNGLILSEGMTS
jgi:hypothetical protein